MSEYRKVAEEWLSELDRLEFGRQELNFLESRLATFAMERERKVLEDLKQRLKISMEILPCEVCDQLLNATDEFLSERRLAVEHKGGGNV